MYVKSAISALVSSLKSVAFALLCDSFAWVCAPVEFNWGVRAITPEFLNEK
jgi:hypothetical protein